MRVLFVTDSPTIGGGEVYLREMLPRLRAMGLQVEAALPLVAGNEPIRTALAEQSVPVYGYASLQDLPQHHELRIASTWYPQNLAKILKHWSQAPAILLHDQIDMHYGLGLDRVYRLGYRLLQVPHLRRARAVLTVSNWAREFLHDIHGIPAVYAIQNGVNTQRFRPATPEEQQSLRNQLGWQRFNVLVPGRMSLEKNHGAVFLTARQTPEMDYWLVGTGELMGVWQKTVRLMGPANVHFLGRRMDMPDLYRAADAVLLPTLGENQSLATLEAMSSGLAVVTSKIPAQLELIQAGEGLTLPLSPSHLAAGLKELQQQPQKRHQLGQAARAKVLAQHTLETSAQNLAKVLSELVA